MTVTITGRGTGGEAGHSAWTVPIVSTAVSGGLSWETTVGSPRIIAASTIEPRDAHALDNAA